MLHEEVKIKIDYKKAGIAHDDFQPTLTTYILENYPEVQGERKRPLVIVCPGGGYGHHSPREGEAIALKMNSFGFHACILRYSLVPDAFPCQLFEAAYTMNYVKQHAKEWCVDTDKIIIAGFSAGAHVSASLGTMWNEDIVKTFAKNILNTDYTTLRPNGMLLAYPVLTSGEFAHRQSFQNLLGDRYEELLDYVSLENRVDKETPSTFIWHTFEDGTVPVENSIIFANALRKNDIRFEMHIFPSGGHGLGLGTKETDVKDGSRYQPECACWVDMFNTWVEKNMN